MGHARGTREFYIMNDARCIEMAEVGLVFYTRTDGDIYLAQCFKGRAAKPLWYYWFESQAKMEAKIEAQITSTRQSLLNKAKAKEALNQPSTLKVGDILVTSWGYDQTNVDFYKVTATRGKRTVDLVQIGYQSVPNSEGVMCDRVVPEPEVENTTLSGRRVSHGSKVKIHRFATAVLWSGHPMYRSWYA